MRRIGFETAARSALPRRRASGAGATARLVRMVLAAMLPALAWAAPAGAISNDASQQAAELYQKHDWHGLASLAEQAIRADANDGWGWYYEGLAEDGLGRRDQAAASYERALPTITPYLHDSVVQLLAQDYAALNQADELNALYRQVKSANPALARNLAQQFPNIIGQPPAPAPALPAISPQSIAALSANIRGGWRRDAIPVAVSIDALDNDFGLRTVIDYYSPSTRAGLAVVSVRGEVSRMPVENPRWGTLAIPDSFLPLSAALARIEAPSGARIAHAYLFRRYGDAANPLDLVWSIALQNGDKDAWTVPAYLMSQRELGELVAAADRGDARVELALALAYGTGVAGAPDLAQSVAWLKKAAGQGNAQAEDKLGQFYQLGIGMRADAATAATWYLAAAKQNFAPAQFNLGLLYETGLGVKQDWIRADHWITEAAERGLQPAYAEMTRVRNAAKREQHAHALAAQQHAAATRCGPGSYPFNTYDAARGWHFARCVRYPLTNEQIEMLHRG